MDGFGSNDGIGVGPFVGSEEGEADGVADGFSVVEVVEVELEHPSSLSLSLSLSLLPPHPLLLPPLSPLLLSLPLSLPSSTTGGAPSESSPKCLHTVPSNKTTKSTEHKQVFS